MATLDRNDGKQFVLNTYRELMDLDKPALFKQEVRSIAQQNGEYIRIYRKPEGKAEVIFSRYSGYLLAEVIWGHLKKPKNFIYCEKTKDNLMLLIVTIDGQMHQDSHVTLDNFADEIASLANTEASFDIYTYGDTPLAKDPAKSRVAVHPNFIRSYTALNQSLFESVSAREEYHLLPLEKALNVDWLRPKMPGYILSGAVTAIIIAGAYWWLSKPKESIYIAPQEQKVDAYKGYKQLLSSPQPDKIIADTVQFMQILYTIPGWDPVNVGFHGSSTTARLNNQGGSVSKLLSWLQQYPYIKVDLTPNGPVLTYAKMLSKRRAPNTITKLQPLLASLFDKINSLSAEKSIHLIKTTQHSHFQETDVVIQFHNLTPNLLELFGNKLTDLPARLTGLDANLNNGLWSGQIKLTVVGN